MKRSTSVRTTHSVVLENETEYFGVQSVDGKTFRVERVVFTEESGGRTDLHFAGTYLLKSGKLSQRRSQNYSTWEHSRRFTPAASQALIDALPVDIIKALREMGANV